MFDELSQRFEAAVRNLKGQASISESNVDGALKEVRRALLEADVSLTVVKDFVDDVRRKAIGAEVVRGISPDQKFIQVVHEQLVETMGGENAPLAAAGKPGQPTVVLMARLQGAGKTTATAKLGQPGADRCRWGPERAGWGLRHGAGRHGRTPPDRSIDDGRDGSYPRSGAA